MDGQASNLDRLQRNLPSLQSFPSTGSDYIQIQDYHQLQLFSQNYQSAYELDSSIDDDDDDEDEDDGGDDDDGDDDDGDEDDGDDDDDQVFLANGSTSYFYNDL